jgi:tetratricopeptide (TPR) repeat protein
MATITEMLENAAEHHRAGKLQDAEQLYKQVLRDDPRNPVALYLLGTVARQTGRNELAIDYIGQALRLKPDYIEAHNNLGNALAAQGQLIDAAASYQRALRFKPDYAEAHNNLGNILVDLGKLDQAVASYQQAVRHNPQFGEAQCNLGLTLKTQGKLNEALACFRQAMGYHPRARAMYDNLKKALASQGNLDEAQPNLETVASAAPGDSAGNLNVGDFHLGQGRLDEAAASYRRALSLQPDIARGINNLGVALFRQGKLEEGMSCYRTALQINPGFAEAFHSLGLALASQGKLEAAAAHHRQALELKPGFAEALNSLGVVLHRQAKLDEAMACYEQALRLQPDSALPHFNRALIWLLAGNFEQGWPEYEWRLKGPNGPVRPSHPPRWDGSPLAGRTILLYAEQGLGDTLHFIRYASVLHEQGARVVVEAQKPLIRLLSGNPGIDQLVAQGTILPDCDVQASLLDVPGVLRTSLATIPAKIPYIHADTELIEDWHRELSGLPGFKIGIAWQGNPDHPLDQPRSVALKHFAPLARLEGVRLISLQKGPGAEQLAALTDPFPVTDLSARLDEKPGAFMDTAAVMKNLDLIVTSDTAIAHLAGALGVPVWVALSLVPDWRWLLHRDDSPWYPTMRLFRQTELGNWQEVFARLASAVQKLAAEAGK